MIKKSMFWHILIFILSFASLTLAGENIFYHGMRPMAMGGAFVAVGDDYNSRNWNPAALAIQPSWDLTFEASPRVSKDIVDELVDASQGKGLIKDTIDVLDEFENETNGSSGISMSSPTTTKLFNQVDKIAGKIMEGDAETYLGFSIRPWKLALGVSLNAKSLIYIKKSNMSANTNFYSQAIGWVDNKVIFNMTGDVVPTVGKAFTIKEVLPVPQFLSDGDTADRDINFGFNFKYLLRQKREIEMAFTDLGNKTRQAELGGTVKNIADAPTGNGMGLDFGTLIKVNDYLNFGLNVQDIGLSKIKYTDKTSSSGTTLTQAEEEFLTNVRIGTAFKPLKFLGYKKLKALDMTLTADLDNLNGKVRDKKDFSDKTHLGFETKFTLWRDFIGLGLRVGENQGFPSYGLTLNTLWFFSAQYAFYGTEFTDYHTASLGVVF